MFGTASLEMCKTVFPNRVIFWSLWSNILYLIGMVGYCFADGFEYLYPGTLDSSVSSIIYVSLAAVFIFDSFFEVLVVINIDSRSYLYNVMALSVVFDIIGSYGYFLGALFAATSVTSVNTALLCIKIGVLGFAIGAILNMIAPAQTMMYVCANSLNLLASLLYVLAVIITNVEVVQIIVILGDVIYVIDAAFYMACWFFDRQYAILNVEETLLVPK